MTTIAYRDGVMAADSGVWHGDATHPWARKVAKGRDGTLYGVTGEAAQCDTFLNWVDGGCVGDEPKAIDHGKDGSSFCVVIAKEGEPIRYRTATGDEVYHAPYFAVGGGAQAAYGAMFAGSGAQVAIQAAIEHGSSAVGKVQFVSFEDAESSHGFRTVSLPVTGPWRVDRDRA